MKITMYELLGLIKEDKAPSKIKYIDKIYSYYNSDYRFWDDEYESYGYLTSYIGNSSFDVLNDEIEIIEEKENNKIEKLTPFESPFLKNDKPDIRFQLIINQLNELIDVIDELRGKDES